jgi:BASS family bile acid:Na+ symporter
MKPALVGILMNYGVLGGLLLATGKIFVQDAALWKGFVILACVPPAVAVIPFASFLRGDTTFSLLGAIGGYLGALVIMPLIALSFLGPSVFDPGKLVVIMAELIFAPLMVSRLLLWTGLSKPLEPLKGPITNWSFFVVVYTVVGLNQEVFVAQPLRLLPVAAIAVGSTFLLGFIIERITRALRIDPQLSTTLVLLGTLKNYGLAGGIALALFSKQTALPATVSTVFMIVYIVWLSLRKRGSS